MKVPAAWLTAGVKKETKVESKIDMSADVAGMGKCPECKQQMEIVSSNGSKVWACAHDRISIPVPDGHQA
jgi:hypothetical protein